MSSQPADPDGQNMDHATESNLPSDMLERVSLSKMQYSRLVNKIILLERKVKAKDNICSLISEKEHEVEALKEKIQNYSDALIQSELHLHRLISITLKQNRHKNGNPDSEKQKFQNDGQISTGLATYSGPECVTVTGRDKDASKSPGKHYDPSLEVDSPERELNQHSSGNTGSSGGISSSGGTSLSGGISSCGGIGSSGGTGHPAVDISGFHTLQCFSTNNNLSIVKTVDSKPQNFLNIEILPDSGEHCSDPAKLNNPEGTHLPKVSDKSESILLPETFVTLPLDTSRDLVDKLMQQNARLKRICRQILNSRGESVSDFLDKEEYSEIVEHLRQDLRESQFKIRELQELLAIKSNNNVQELTDKCLLLQNKVQKFGKAVFVKQAMVDVFSDKCKQLENDLKHNKSVLEVGIKTQGGTKAAPGDTKVEAVKSETLWRQEITNELEEKFHSKYCEIEVTYQKQIDDLIHRQTQMQLEITNLKSLSQSKPAFCHANSEPCGVTARRESHHSLLPRLGLCVDSCESELSTDDQEESAQKSSNEPTEESNLVCERCERVFDAKDKIKFDDHCKKCID